MKRSKLTRRITLALIGAGRWGTSIQRTVAALPDAKLQYVETHDWRRLLRAPDLDGVLIATPASTHAAIASPFIEQNIPVFIEKPLTSSLRDALALESLVRKHRAIAMVGHVHLYSPAFKAAARAVRHAGRIRYILAEGMNNGPFRNDISCLWDWAPHDLSMTLSLLGSFPKTVRAWGVRLLRPRTRFHDVATIHAEFPHDVHFFGAYSWLSPMKRKRLTVVCARNTVVYDDTTTHKVTVYRGLGPTMRGGRVRRLTPIVTHPPHGSTAPLTRELRWFLHSIRTGSPPPSDLTQGVTIIRILDAADRSILRDGRPIRLGKNRYLPRDTLLNKGND